MEQMQADRLRCLSETKGELWLVDHLMPSGIVLGAAIDGFVPDREVVVP